LPVLNLSKNDITPDAIEAIEKSSLNDQLAELDLSGNDG